MSTLKSYIDAQVRAGNLRLQTRGVQSLADLFDALEADLQARAARPAKLSYFIPLTGMDVMNLSTGHGISRERAHQLAQRTEITRDNLTDDVPQVLQAFDALGHPAEIAFRWNPDAESVEVSIELMENVAEFVARDSAADQPQ